MSIIVSSGETISKHILNTSHSKQMYSFSRSKRFNLINRANSSFSSFYYNLPSMHSKRSTSIGYGKKSDFTKEKKWNAPFYHIDRLFDAKRKQDGPSYTFGVSRECFEKVIIDNELSVPERISPGPGRYETTRPFGSEAPRYSIKKKLFESALTKKCNDYPGPGKYNHVKLSNQGRYPSSKMRNTTMVGWSLSKESRFKRYKEITPGPNAYLNKVLINGRGTIYNSKYKSSLGRSFIGRYKDHKCSYIDDPGPGSYQTFSEFGIYQSKHAEKFEKRVIYQNRHDDAKTKKIINKSASVSDVNKSQI